MSNFILLIVNVQCEINSHENILNIDGVVDGGTRVSRAGLCGYVLQ